MSGGGLRRRRLGCLAAAETWVSGGCGNGLGFWRLLRRLGCLEAAAEAFVSGGCGGDLLLDLHMSLFYRQSHIILT